MPNEVARNQTVTSPSKGDGSSQTKTAFPATEALRSVFEEYFDEAFVWQRRIEVLEENVRSVTSQLGKFVGDAHPSVAKSLEESIAEIHKHVASFSILLRKYVPGPNSDFSDHPGKPNSVEEQASDRADSNKLARIKDRLPSAGGMRWLPRFAGGGGEATEPDQRRVPEPLSIEALRELLADFSKRATDQEASQRTVEKLPWLFDILDPCFDLLESEANLPGENKTVIETTREQLRDWQNRLLIHRIPRINDPYDERTARIIERVSTPDPEKHNRIKEVRTWGYEWKCEPPRILREAEVIIWVFES